MLQNDLLRVEQHRCHRERAQPAGQAGPAQQRVQQDRQDETGRVLHERDHRDVPGRAQRCQNR